MRTLIAFLLLTIPAFAQELKAAIKGPATALAGTLVFLSYEEATGDNKVWIIPDELKSASASCGSNIFFSIPTPGKYQFGLIVANKQAEIAYSWHEINVTGSIAPPPTPPLVEGPAPPPPVVVPSFPNDDVDALDLEDLFFLFVFSSNVSSSSCSPNGSFIFRLYFCK